MEILLKNNIGICFCMDWLLCRTGEIKFKTASNKVLIC